MIALAVVALLVAIAYPSYMESTRKSRRSDAVAALTRLQLAQERWRANNTQYASVLADLGGTATSQGGFYDIDINSAVASSYVMTASASPGKSQASDTSCKVMRLQVVGGNIFYGGCNNCAVPVAPATVSDPDRCWSR